MIFLTPPLPSNNYLFLLVNIQLLKCLELQINLGKLNMWLLPVSVIIMVNILNIA